MKGQVKRLRAGSSQENLSSSVTLFGNWSDSSQGAKSVEIAKAHGVVSVGKQRGKNESPNCPSSLLIRSGPVAVCRCHSHETRMRTTRGAWSRVGKDVCRWEASVVRERVASAPRNQACAECRLRQPRAIRTDGAAHPLEAARRLSPSEMDVE